MDIAWIKLASILLASTGFGKLVEVLLKHRIERKHKKAETGVLHVQASSQIIDGWIGWSQKLEARVKELEGYNTRMKETIEKQRRRICELEKHVGSLEKDNKNLVIQLEVLKNSQNGKGQ